MEPIQLFDLASRQAHWLTVRQSVAAGNIANANTPGYKAKTVEAFDAVLNSFASKGMTATNPAHFSEDKLRNSVTNAEIRDGVEVLPSGNSVSLADEMISSGEIRRSYELNTGVVKAFNRMMLLTVRK